MTGWGADGLTVVRGAKAILQGVTVAWRAGTLNALLGPNGSGKTTLLRLLAGLVEPDEGVVASGQTRLWREEHWARHVACSLGPAVEDLPFCVEEVLLSSQYPDGGRWLDPSPERRAPLVGLLTRLEVFPEGADVGLERSYSTLSDGERQLVDVARAVLQNTPVLLLDEPTSALDLRHRLLVRALLAEEAHQRGRLVVLSLHDLAEVTEDFDSATVLHRGRLVASGPPPEVLTQELLGRVWGVAPSAGGFRLI